MCVLSPCAPPPSPPAVQERAELAAGRRHLEARQALYAELQTQLDNCPESVREQLQEQLRRVSSSPCPGPRGPPTQTEERRAVGRDCPAPAVPAGHRVGAEDRRGQARLGGSSAPGCVEQSRGSREGTGSLLRFPGWSPRHSSLWPGLPGPGWQGEHHPMLLSLKEAEALETETKLFEDLEFQQLERESRAEEERELAGQGLLRSKAELLRSVAKRKVGNPCCP